MRVLYFAWVRDRVGMGEETVQPPPEVATVADLMAWLAGRGPGYAAAFADPDRLRCALDHDYATADAPLGAAREVAFFPPVTGG